MKALQTALIASALVAGIPAFPADPAPANSEIQTKAAEVQQLRDQLRQRETELERLRAENEKLRRQKESAPAQSPTSSRRPEPPPPPSRPIQSLSLTDPASAISADDLVAYFASDAPTAASRFVGQEFVIHGTVARFEGKLLQRRVTVVFESAGEIVVRASVGLPPAWDAVFVAKDGASLVKRSELGTRTMLKRGDEIRVRGRCTGRQGTRIAFDRAEILPGR